jgi:hypothetical protein
MQMGQKIFIKNANGYPEGKGGIPNIELNDESIIFTPREGRNLYS